MFGLVDSLHYIYISIGSIRATLNPQQLADLWQGTLIDEYAEATIIGTTAITLTLIGQASSQSDAENKAKALWNNRNYNIK